MKEFFVTVAANMPHGSGHWVIEAEDESSARAKAFAELPDGRWSFIYPNLEAVHPFDRLEHGRIK